MRTRKYFVNNAAKGFRRNADPSGQIHRLNAMGVRSGRGVTQAGLIRSEGVDRALARQEIETTPQFGMQAPPVVSEQSPVVAQVPSDVSRRSFFPGQVAGERMIGKVATPGTPQFDPSLGRI